MSRIDEALRRAARGSEWNDATDPASVVEPTVRHVNPSFLERYAAEEPAPVETAGARRDAVRAAEVTRGPEAAPRQAPRSAKPAAVVPTVAFRAQLGGFSPALQGKLVISGDASQMSVEQYRRLAGTLHHLHEQRGLKTVMVSSAVPREGKTLTAANLALTLSESYNRRVLLIDADLRRPSIHEVFGFPNKVGLANLARRGGGELPLVEVGTRLTVLPAGSLDSTAPTAELTSDCMRPVISDAASRFDWVILDTPPVGLLPDAHLIAEVAEGVLFVIAAGSTPYTLVQRAIAELGAERIIGTVLNRVQKDGMPANPYYRGYYESDGSDRRMHP